MFKAQCFLRRVLHFNKSSSGAVNNDLCPVSGKGKANTAGSGIP